MVAQETKNSGNTSSRDLMEFDAHQMLEQSYTEDSSFYGDGDTKGEYSQRLSEFDDEDYWRVHEWNLQVVVTQKNSARSKKRKRRNTSIQSEEPDIKKSKFSAHAENTAQPSGIPDELHNPYEGYPNALQIGESVDDFLERVKSSIPLSTQPWIWCANFKSTHRDTDARLAEFKDSGTLLLDQYAQKRRSLEDSFDPPKPPGSIARMLQPDREQLQIDLLQTAKRHGVITGKWMLFATQTQVDQYWGSVVRATVDGRLGISAKVSTKPSGKSDTTRVICVYANNFDDQADLKRILIELIRLGLAAAVSGPLQKRSKGVQDQIYFKADAYTWLDITSDNEYKLKASLYSTASLFTEDDLAAIT